MGWKEIADSFSGVATVKHAVLTVGGTFESAPGTQYPSNVVNGLAEFVNPDLCFEVPIDYPASFGPLSGVTADSYDQSIAVAIANMVAWLQANSTQTFALGGYSQGGEAVSRLAMALMGQFDVGVDVTPYAVNWIGGYTFGNPCRMAGAVAPGIGNPGPQWRGISSVNMIELPTINNVVVWADYIHSTANGDPANDMYGMVPVSDVGTIMTDVYTAAVETQLNDITAFSSQIVSALEQLVEASGLLSGLSGGLAGLIGLGLGAGISFLTDLIGGVNINATGAEADVSAAVLGLQFLAAPGGSTGPHISYLGPEDGLPEYSNLVADAVDFLGMIATLTPPRA
jgi:PE-PPE domain